ncbi:helix-turn-helix domain-containing protein [Aurantimonas aggregata]|uniref:Helix-turn-helix domain-containing protein n=1 Tax=Aurantimonas aggregata TaxID=2047720 RepID=A0A6L9MED0_9HYPH|nr:helix-turn-helix domain-containing protein [Aurantimonas aggregata]NDV85932.1 helix-turn-helix domain-containing protein [Aurantimonas aggregata]
MDLLIAAAARALASGDPLAALNRVALRDDPPALALRGIAMAQLGDLGRATALLRRAARGFGPGQPIARARCAVAEAEIAFVSRDLAWPEAALEAARATLEARGDQSNAAHARTLQARRQLLVGRIGEAERTLAGLDPASLPAASRAACELVAAGIALRRIDTKAARVALDRAGIAAREARIPALVAEVEAAARALDTPSARLIAGGRERPLLLEDVENLLASEALIIDACRHGIRAGDVTLSLATRPVLFALARALAEAWPADAARRTLLQRAFGARHVDESHRARLRVEIGRLRAALGNLAKITATKNGFALKLHHQRAVVVLAPPVENRHAGLLALLADGEAWSSSALAIALGASSRTVQRALDTLARAGKVQSFGRARSRRWTVPSVPGFPTVLLLPGPLPSD